MAVAVAQGPDECLYNTLEGCAIVHYPETSQWLPFVACLEVEYPNLGKYTQTCAEKASMDWNTLNTCWKGPEGKKIQIENARKTAALNPPHQYVPWVVIDGQVFVQADDDSVQPCYLWYVSHRQSRWACVCVERRVHAGVCAALCATRS